jgi:hypothetical protein
MPWPACLGGRDRPPANPPTHTVPRRTEGFLGRQWQHPAAADVLERQRRPGSDHSHSIVAGGFDEMSYTTRLIPRTSLITRVDIRASSS